MRVGNIMKKTHLSRPTVSHHLKVLLDSEVIGATTKNFYWLKLGGAWQSLELLVQSIERLRTMEGKPDEQKIYHKRNL